ncbi:sensor histidine kinase [Mucilaginibacter terrae]|uniref:histidine kinase n=1 Tax=Mucilaginibacter terrae TaxID=1955052 RepID=A0ABU3GQ15_9SPHI|nr:CHASE3 domain-containing protein [Mucilaginibacter terrae]MDT3401621.1 PAS domain S-box-containing protein [Mucilaginibacter terrae]
MINNFNRYLKLGYGFSLLILIAVSSVSYVTLTQLIHSNELVSHSGEVMQKLGKLLSVVKDAETGQRGYLLTGKTQFLEPYNGAYQKAADFTAELKNLTADNKAQQANIETIHTILKKRLNILQEITVKKLKDEIISASDLDAGKAAMDALREAVAKAEADENILLKERTSKVNFYSDLTPWFIVGAGILAFVVVVYSYKKVTNDISIKDALRSEIEKSERETTALNEELTAANEELTAMNEELAAAREELVTANEQLEQRVEERTKELQNSHEETQALNEELSAMNEELSATNEDLNNSEHRLQQMVDEISKAYEHSAKLVAIVESSDDAIIGKDLNGIVTSWNRGAENIFGYAEDEIVGKPILTLIPQDRQHEEPTILSRLRNGEKIDHYETIRQTKDGKLIDVSLTISPIKDKEGRVTGVSKIARNITEQKQNEQRKNDFIGMASHELKTPLTSLNALIQVLQHREAKSPDTFAFTALNKAAQQSRKMTALINGFLNVSRLESGKLNIDKHQFDLQELISESINDMRLTVTSHQFIFEHGNPIKIIADRDKIGSVISNLLSNAVKYSPRGESVVVETQINDDEVWVSVKDEGMGIKPQDKEKLFERYYRVNSDHTKYISGFGVGLYLSAEIIKQHQGRIWVDSEKGIGSTFWFTLPL